MNKKWYVLAFTSNKFRSVENFLKLKGVCYFCPMRSNDFFRDDKQYCIRKRSTPTFPGYLFVEMDFELMHPEQLSAFQYIYGLITFGKKPVPVDEKTITALMENDRSEDCYSMTVKKSISHEFACVLLIDDPVKRSVALLKYITEIYEQSLKEVKYAS